jgi:hypothetical protein
MRINTKVVTDIESGEVLERESFDYPDTFPVDECNKAIEGAALLAGAAVLGAATLGVGFFAGTALEAALASTMFTANAIVGLAAAGVAMEAGALAQALTSSKGEALTTRQAAAFRQIIYGQQRVGGVEIWRSSTGSKHDQLNYVIVLAGHPCDSIVNLYLDGRQVHWKGPGDTGNETNNGVNFGGSSDSNTYTGPDGNTYNFGGKVYCHATLGNQTDGTVDQGLTANDPKWAADGQGNSPWVAGCTYVYLKIEYDPSTFPNEPEIRFTVNGKNNIWDPRTQSNKFTANWALCAADVITDPVFGLGSNTVNQAQLVAAANVCDEQITVAALVAAGTIPSTEAQYTTNWHYDTSATPHDVLTTMMAGAAGRMPLIGGQYYLFPAYFQGATATFGPSNLTSAFKWDGYRSVRDLINCVNGTYIAPTYPYNITGNLYDKNGWYNGTIQNNFPFAFQPTNFPQYADDHLHGFPAGTNEWLTEDGGIVHPLELTLSTVLSVTQAQRVAAIVLRRNRQQGSTTLEMNLAAYGLQPCDTFQMNFPKMNWVNKLLEVNGTAIHVDTDDSSGAQTIRYGVSVQETDPTVYEWVAASQELNVDAIAASPSQTPRAVAPPTNMQLFSGPNVAQINPDGTVNNLIVVEWDTPLDFLATSININYRLSGTTTWIGSIGASVTQNLQWISNVVPGQFYDIQINSQRANGNQSTWVQQLNYQVSLTPTFLGTLAAQIPGITAGALLGGTTPGEMLTNSNFQSGLTGWLASAGTATIDTAQHQVASQSARFEGTELAQGINLIAGHTYLLQAWVMTDGNVLVNGAKGAGIYIFDPSLHITVQKVNGVQGNLSGFPSALVAASAATSWTLVQLTFAVGASGTYQVTLSDSYGASPRTTTTHTWFSGVSLTDQTGAADVTASQPIVYTATGSSIIPNGTFALGTLQGWILNPAAPATLGSDSFGQRAHIPGGVGGYVFSPAFQVNPGAKYRITYTVYNVTGSGGIVLRVAWQPGPSQPANVIPAGTGVTTNPGFSDFLVNGSVTTSPLAMAYDWTAPAGISFASLALYAVGASDLAIQSVSCIPYAASGQWGSDVTGSNTANDTNNVDGVPSTTIAAVVPSGFKLFINSGARTYSITAI